MSQSIQVPANEMKQCFVDILLSVGFTDEKADKLAGVFTANSLDGIYTHGVNRFPRFIDYVLKGYTKKDAEATLINTNNGVEQWDGQSGPGILNAITATDRSIALAGKYGIGCVALRNTNHWMRGGYYGWRAAGAGCIFIGFTNTVANMPAYGATDARLGNNPLVIALPYNDSAIVLDMAMSQYSFGSLELFALKNEQLPEMGGYDEKGNLTKDPAAIIASKRPLPVGYWKGAGLSLLLDLLAALLSGGLSTHEISRQPAEYGLSQVFISIDTKTMGQSSIALLLDNIIDDYKQSVAAGGTKSITYPGERVLQSRKRNTEKGIPVIKEIWDEILQLKTRVHDV